jgi:hypothetical protein
VQARTAGLKGGATACGVCLPPPLAGIFLLTPTKWYFIA